MDGCVVRELKRKLDRDGSGGQDDYKHWVFATLSHRLQHDQDISVASRDRGRP